MDDLHLESFSTITGNRLWSCLVLHRRPIHQMKGVDAWEVFCLVKYDEFHCPFVHRYDNSYMRDYDMYELLHFVNSFLVPFLELHVSMFCCRSIERIVFETNHMHMTKWWSICQIQRMHPQSHYVDI